MTRSSMMITIATLLAAVALSAAEAQPGRAVYEIEVTAPLTKSQGLRGTLYDARGRAIEAGPAVETPIGTFRWIECRMPWETCGRWREGGNTPRSSYVREGRPPLSYRIVRDDRRDGSYWTGELAGIRRAPPAGQRLRTPMGEFRWTSGRLGRMHWRGWVPQEWPDLPFAEAAAASPR